MKLLKTLGIRLLLVGLLSTPYLWANAQENAEIPLVVVDYHQDGSFEWWNHEGISLEQKAGEYTVVGNGRLILKAGRAPVRVVTPMVVLELAPGGAVFVDQVNQQSRVMVLQEQATITDSHRKMRLSASLQVVVCPKDNPGSFIDDGVYRRPIMKQFEDAHTLTIIRQFYLEQTAYADPILRTLYQQKGPGKALVKSINKTGAILRELDGTHGYEAGQV